jgi:hypothetical protein
VCTEEAASGAAAMPRRRNREQEHALAEVEKKLEALKIENKWSMNRLADEVKRRGICLRSGKEYGGQSKLRKAMNQDLDLIVRKEEVKAFPHAKKCLVVLNP